MVLDQVRALIADDMEAVDRLIIERLQSDVALVNQLAVYIVSSGGKRMRPILTLLAAGASGYTGQQHRNLAAIIEFIHTATLLHDDVVDASELRRGRNTANALFGNEASVLVGDFLYSRAFQMMVEIGQMRVMEILADATNLIAEGEVMQLMNVHEPDISEQRYLDVIQNKTATLFEAACRLGAVIAGRESAEEQALAAYGRHLGIAFQLIDDAFDYSASSEAIGKNVGDDLAEGKPTLPLILAMRNGTEAQAAVIRESIRTGGRERIAEVMAAIEATDAIRYTVDFAEREAALARVELESLPSSQFRSGLEKLAAFSVERTF